MFLKDLSEFSLQGLRVFCYVASMGSVVEAAEALGLTQPAVSLQIHNLEKLLGTHLFERQGRKNVLTSRGTLLYRKLLPQLEKIEDILVSSKESQFTRMELSLGSVEGVGEFWLWSQFRDFSKGRDDLRLSLEIDESEKLQDLLLTGRLSLIITPRKIEHLQVVSQVLMDERLLPIGTPENIQRLNEALDENPRSDRPWEKINWVGRGDNGGPDPWSLRWLESIGLIIDRRFRYFHQATSYTVVKNLLLQGAGVCVAPTHTFGRELKERSLVSLDSKKYPALLNRLYVSHREASLNPIHLEFKDWILKEGSEVHV